MRHKTSGSQPEDQPTDTRGPGTDRHVPSRSPELEPIPPQKLEIASLARGQPGAAEESRPAEGGGQQLTVGLYRRNLGIGVNAGYFTLKMMLVRALRRSLKSAVIEVDDAEGEAPADRLFEIQLHPADAKALARATRSVQRVLRARRWQSGLSR